LDKKFKLSGLERVLQHPTDVRVPGNEISSINLFKT